jgi:hypothetical protein
MRQDGRDFVVWTISPAEVLVGPPVLGVCERLGGEIGELADVVRPQRQRVDLLAHAQRGTLLQPSEATSNHE